MASIRSYFFHKSRREMHLGYLYHYHIPRRTEECYVQGIQHGVEYRYPLLDKRIVEYMLNVPSELLYKGEVGRIILREITKDLLPENVRWSKVLPDYSLMKHVDGLCRKLYMDYFHELPLYKENPDLIFFNFHEFSLDLKKMIDRPEKEPIAALSATFFYLKWMHEFSRNYHS